MLPDVIAGIASIVCLMFFLKVWKPASIWSFKDEVPPAHISTISYSPGEVLRAWSPFIMLTVVILAWGLQPVKDLLNSIGQVKFNIPGLHNAIYDVDGNPLAQTFKLNFLSATGTAILLSALISLPLIGIRFGEAAKIFASTCYQLRFAIITIASVLGFAYIVNNSGITITMAKALASTGFLFPFFAPILGWLGVFITGSDTSSNALFAKLQYATATSIGVDPVVTVGANVSGGVVGKMISPQSIAVAAAAGNLIGKESELFRFTVKHSFIMLLFVCLLTMLQAYTITWIIPEYKMIETNAIAPVINVWTGVIYLLLLVLAIASIAITIYFLKNRKGKIAVTL